MKAIQQLLNQGVLQESKSPWAYRLGKVAKRQWGDLHKLNATGKDAFPIPKIIDCFEALSVITCSSF